jgi:tetratricopeptide (TPR) repeat protein
MRRLFGFNSPISPTLKRANACMASADYLAAAKGYEELLEQSGPRPGPQFAFVCLQAGSARLQAGQSAQAVNHFRRGLDILATHSRYAQMYHSGQRIKAELEKRGMVREARVFMAQVHSSMPAAAEMPTQHVSEQLPALPPTCPVCGGFVRVFELHWLNAHTAECSFCASPLEIA